MKALFKIAPKKSRGDWIDILWGFCLEANHSVIKSKEGATLLFMQQMDTFQKQYEKLDTEKYILSVPIV